MVGEVIEFTKAAPVGLVIVEARDGERLVEVLQFEEALAMMRSMPRAYRVVRAIDGVVLAFMATMASQEQARARRVA